MGRIRYARKIKKKYQELYQLQTLASADLDLGWLDIEDWAHTNKAPSTKMIPLAAVAEMADRTFMNNWDENLDAILVAYNAEDIS